jgi:hypothetical protein
LAKFGSRELWDVVIGIVWSMVTVIVVLGPAWVGEYPPRIIYV